MDYEQELHEFWLKVKEMREAQKAYFKGRSYDDLQKSKRLESEVDAITRRLEGEFGPQRTLF